MGKAPVGASVLACERAKVEAGLEPQVMVGAMSQPFQRLLDHIDNLEHFEGECFQHFLMLFGAC